MRVSLFSILLGAILVGAGYFYLHASFVCPTPISYRVGEVDARFNLSIEAIKQILDDSAQMWEESVGRDLFVYDENSDFMVNFIFDERQQLAVTEEGWRHQLDAKERESKLLVDRVKEMSETYEGLQAKYTQSRQRYEERLNAYNRKVEQYNNDGGAPPQVFEELNAEQRELSQLSAQLSRSETELNNLADQLNELGEKGNQLIDEYNEGVTAYNKVFGEASLFTQGDFSRERINIYKFSDRDELTRVIAHEFGHSLGIGHVDEEDSIMYYLTKETNGPLVMSEEDVGAFLERCGDGTGFSHKVGSFIRTVQSNF